MGDSALDGWLQRLESLHPKTIDLGLARVKKVHSALSGTNHKPYTITVAGTNGKGSCIALLEAILRAEGYRVGSYTSPHLLRYNERIRLNGIAVDDQTICDVFERIDQARGETSLSYFEFGTLAAIEIFSHAELDLQLMEVGLGGRLDAVNILEPNVTLITTIDIDHSDWLGESRDAIALEKAGVFRAGVAAVIGDRNPPAVLLERAHSESVPFTVLGIDFDYQSCAAGWRWSGSDQTADRLPWPGLVGEHQLQNSSTVLETLSQIRTERPVSQQAIRRGLESVRLAGRLQFIPAAVPMLLDVAHNLQAAKLLAEHLRKEYSDRSVIALFSMMRDKDIAGVIETMKPVVDGWFVAPLKMARCAGTEQIRAAFSACQVTQFQDGFDDLASALASARHSANEKTLIVIFGSFFLAAEYLNEHESIT